MKIIKLIIAWLIFITFMIYAYLALFYPKRIIEMLDVESVPLIWVDGYIWGMISGVLIVAIAPIILWAFRIVIPELQKKISK